MKYGLSLQKKGLLLVAVPLIFELAFIAELADLKGKAEEAAARSSRSRAIVSDAQALTKYAYDAANVIVLYGMLKSASMGERFEKVRSESEKQMADLEKQIGTDQTQSGNFKVLELCMANANDIMERFKARIERRDTTFTNLEVPILTKEIAACLNKLFAANSKIVEQENIEGLKYPEQEERTKEEARNWLIIGVVANIFITCAMAIYFSRDITDRIAIIVKNAMQLAGGGRTIAAVGGGDEVAQLNLVLNDVATLLQEASRRERTLVDNVQDVICTLAPNYTITRVSPSAKQLWGRSESEVLGQRLGNFLAEPEKESFFQNMESSKASENAVQFEALMTRGNGTSVWVLWSAYWSPAESSFFCVAHDVNQRKELEQLRQDFFNMMSHDMRTPITSFKLFVQMLQEGVYGTLNDTGRDTAAKVEASVAKVDQLVNDLLDVEKLETGQMQLRFEPTSTAAIIESAVEMVAPFAEQRSIKLDCPDKAEIEFVADPGRLLQVLQNLLTNAIKFSPRDAIVQVSSKMLDDRSIEFRVKDDGEGIPLSQQRQVFDRFRQLDNASEVSQKGSGLGLAICKAIVERHGGTIGLDSQPRQGATFWFRVPKDSGTSV